MTNTWSVIILDGVRRLVTDAVRLAFYPECHVVVSGVSRAAAKREMR